MSAASWHDKHGHLWVYAELPRRTIRKIVLYKGDDGKFYEVSALNIRHVSQAKDKIKARPDLIDLGLCRMFG